MSDKMKVYVVTEANLLQPERYFTVKRSKKEAEKAIREVAPHMRKSNDLGKVTSYLSDASKNPLLYFIHEEEI